MMFLLHLLLMQLHDTAGQKTTNEDRDDQQLSDVFDELRRTNSVLIKMNNLLMKQASDIDRLKQGSCGCSMVDRPRDCSDIKAAGFTNSDVYTIYVGRSLRALDVYCDMDTDGGGWLVFQRRRDGSEDFYRNWTDYAAGFGNPTGEFWLGNDNIHWLTNTNKTYRLRVDLGDFHGSTRYAEYSNFRIGSAADKYGLQSVGSYTGTAGDSMTSGHLGQKFSTRDQDNDKNSGSCAVSNKGAWWYGDCHASNLNGRYLSGRHVSYADGIEWNTWTGYHYSLKFTEMKIRPN